MLSCLYKLIFNGLQQSWKAIQTFTICIKTVRHPILSSPQTLSIGSLRLLLAGGALCQPLSTHSVILCSSVCR